MRLLCSCFRGLRVILRQHPSFRHRTGTIPTYALAETSTSQRPHTSRHPTATLLMGKRRRVQSMTQEACTAADEPRAAFFCPACNQQVLNWPVFAKHLQRCCPDLMRGRNLLLDGTAGYSAAELPEAVTQALQAAVAQEEELRQQLVCCTLHA